MYHNTRVLHANGGAELQPELFPIPQAPASIFRLPSGCTVWLAPLILHLLLTELSLLYLHASSGVTAEGGGTNSACQWLLAHGGLKSSGRQGCGFTKHNPIPLLWAAPEEDVLACLIFLRVFVLEQWP